MNVVWQHRAHILRGRQGWGQDALLQGMIQCAAGTQAPAKGDVGAEGAGWKGTVASRPDSDFEPCFFFFFLNELGL